MKGPTLYNIAGEDHIKSLLLKTLQKMMGSEEYVVVPFNYPGWNISDFISKLSFDISKKLFEEGLGIGQRGFKKFDPQRTKLTSEMINELWMLVSKTIAEEVYKTFEAKEHAEIPGIEESINDGVIISRTTGMRGNPDDIIPGREAMKKRAAEIKFDKDEFLTNFKNNLYEHMKKEFGLYENFKEDIPEF